MSPFFSWVSISVLCQRLGYHPKTVARWCHEGRIVADRPESTTRRRWSTTPWRVAVYPDGRIVRPRHSNAVDQFEEALALVNEHA